MRKMYKLISNFLFLSLFCFTAVWAQGESRSTTARDESPAVDRAFTPTFEKVPFAEKGAPRITKHYLHLQFPGTDAATILYDNGPLVTHPGSGGAPDTSRLQNSSLGMTTLGFGHQNPPINNRIADDFTITDPAGWQVDSICFFAYQTGSDTISTIDTVHYRIWDGVPDDPGSNVIFGDTATNRLISTNWSRIYRNSESSPTSTARPIMRNVVSAGVTLGPGTYWLDWQTGGTLTSGPWVPPITILGDTTTGNGLQSTTPGTWNPALDGGTSAQQGFPFLIKGEVVAGMIFHDDFEDTVFTQANWTVTNDGGDCVWEVMDITANSYTLPPTAAGNVFTADSDICGSGTQLLSTATFGLNLSAYGTVSLQFDSDWRTIDTDDTARVKVSPDGGATWITVLEYGGVDARDTTEVLDLTSELAGSANALIAFQSIQPGWDWWWTIDNVWVSGTTEPVLAAKLLLSEIVVRPTGAEYVEIYNPNTGAVNLSDYYLANSTFQGGNVFYYQLVEGGGGGGGFADFNSRFPDSAMIQPNEYQTIALQGDSLFYEAYGVMPTYELYEDGHATPSDAPDMREAVPGSINNQGGLTNGDEDVILYYWDGLSDLVGDVDYLIYDEGDMGINEQVDKTGVSIDGPDPGTDSTMYLPDTPIPNQVPAPVNNTGDGFSSHRIDYSEGTQTMSGGNGVTGADETSENLDSTWTDNSVPTPGGPWQPLPKLNPPRNLQAAASDMVVDLSWLSPLPPGEMGYDDGVPETAFGFSNTGEFAVRFTPLNYPCTLLGIKTYWVDQTGCLDNVEYSVWVNPAGGDNPPTTQIVANTPYTIPARGDFDVVDISGLGVTINQGDFFYSWVQPDTFNYCIGLDRDSYNYSRSWLSFDGGTSWFKIEGFGFPDNLMIRALVQEGSGRNARIVELAPQPVAHSIDPEEYIQLRKQGDLFRVADVDNPNPGGNQNDPLDQVLSYNVYRSQDSVAFNMIATVDSSTLAYTDNNVVNDTTYWYYVTGDYPEGESGPSNIASATPMVAPPEPLMNLVHTPGDLNMAIFNDGSIGAENASFTGPGVTWKGQNGCFVGGPIFGTSAVGSVNGLIGSFGVFGDIQNVTSNFAGGFMSTTDFDQVTEAFLNDAGAPTPYGVDIVQRSYSDTGQEYVFIRYGFVNTTGATLSDFYSGIFIDWDIDASTFSSNRGGYDVVRDLVYQFDTSGTPYYYGVVALDGLAGYKTTPQSPAPTTREGSFTWISTPDPDPIDPAGDFRSWQGAGPMIIAPGDTAWFTFAIVAGDDLPGIQANADSAIAEAIAQGWRQPVGIAGEEDLIPRKFALHQNYPNPFNPTTSIKYDLKKSVDVKLIIYNLLGQEVHTLVNKKQNAGYKSVVWDGRNDQGIRVASGIYIYRIKAGDFVKSRKMILLK